MNTLNDSNVSPPEDTASEGEELFLHFRQQILKARIDRLASTTLNWGMRLLDEDSALMQIRFKVLQADQRSLEEIAANAQSIEALIRSKLGALYVIPDFQYREALQAVADPQRSFWDQVREWLPQD